MKVIFLDCDGVLNHVGCDWSGSVHPLDANCVSRVKALREATGAKIVLSSVWRLGGSGRAALEAAGLFVDSITPDLPGGLTNRALEIRAWLEAHPKVTRWAVLDDERDADLGDGSFFQTSFLDAFWGELEPPYRCTCGQVFPTLQGLDIHLGVWGRPHGYRKGFRL